MKRKRYPVVLSHNDGRTWTIGHRSSRTRATMIEAVKSAAPMLQKILGCTGYEFIFANGAPLRALRGEWTLSFGEDES